MWNASGEIGFQTTRNIAMSEHPNNIRKHGSKISYDALLAFLDGKNASDHVVDDHQ